LYIAKKLDLISRTDFEQSLDEAKRISAMLQKLIQSLGVSAPKTQNLELQTYE
jgi:hypothetical protein